MISARHAVRAPLTAPSPAVRRGAGWGARPGGRELEFDLDRVICDPEYRTKVRDALNRGDRALEPESDAPFGA